MDLLGPDLGQLFHAVRVNRKVSKKPLIQIGISLLHALEEIHHQQYLKNYAEENSIQLDGKNDWEDLLCEQDGRVCLPETYYLWQLNCEIFSQKTLFLKSRIWQYR